MRVELSALFIVTGRRVDGAGTERAGRRDRWRSIQAAGAASAGLAFSSGPPAGSPAFTIAVDNSTTYQQMDGVGASLTDSAGWVLWNKATAAQRMR
jgi:O-glycosyl hydrolase